MGSWRAATLATCCLALALPRGAAEGSSRETSDDASQLEFFERRIRPLLAEHCYECHSARKTPPEGRLRLDSPEHIREGGRTDVAVVPGSPERSLLARAVSYTDVDLRMPPDGRLSDGQIRDIDAWIRMGAPLPAASGSVTTDLEPGIDLEAGRRFWAFQPVADPPLPEVRDSSWPRTPIDRFVLAKLEGRGLTPAPAADRRSWLRRVTFDLIGLPPLPEEIASFEADASAEAHARVVERLLASPHYGERWGRHWLDLVRFAETNGHEFDNDKLDAWRYRDYVIRAFNQDVPYDQLIREHVAGDLIADKRLSPDLSHWDSPLGTGFLWFGEVLNSPVDSVKSRADEVDNQLDVLAKAFQGLTVACARCHDHKFDPIPTADYYAMGGILHSTEISEAVIDSPQRAAEIAAAHQEIAAVNGEIVRLVESRQPRLVEGLESDLLAAAERFRAPTAPPTTGALAAWYETLTLACSRPGHVFHPLAAVLDRLAQPDPPSFSEALAGERAELEAHAADLADVAGLAARRGDESFEDFERLDYGEWRVAGQAFGTGPARTLAPNLPVRDHRGGGIASSFGHGSDALVGSLTSPELVVEKPWVHVRLAGTEEKRPRELAQLRVSIVAAGYKAIHFRPTGSGAFEWQSQQVEELVAGRRCVVEIVDRSREGHIAVDAIVFSDSKQPPPLSSAPSPRVLRMLQRPGIDSVPALVAAYADLFSAAAREDRLSLENRWLASALVPFRSAEGALEQAGGAEAARLRELRQRRGRASERLPESAFALVAREGTPGDARVHKGGSHRNLGEEVPRGFLGVIAGDEQPPAGRGSGRLALARWLASPDNPLTARVMVNRIWQHHFGDGLVASADNFGAMGRRPSHPELLDHLAGEFVRGGWSIKELHRLVLLSSSYRMSSRVEPAHAAADPENALLHHFPVRRLEAEAIRDSVLAVSGRLDRRLFGPGVTPHITEFQDGRGKPESGPLDGTGRRSVYIQVRRNFLTPLFLAFDYPLPVSTIGARGQSTVPSQALSLLNNPFVAEQARHWGRRAVERYGDSERRVDGMFEGAFGRLPEEWERRAALDFVREQELRYGVAPGSAEEKAWGDLAHVLFNSTEFVFLR
jgi:hypothetical protein